MTKKPILLLLLLVLQVTISAQNESNPNRPKVGLVLSGGAAHGLAHIGVLQVLEELEIPIDYITGTSMGAVVGGLKAMGYSSAEIKNKASEINWDKIINNVISLREIAPSEKYAHEKYPLNLEISKAGINLPLSAVEPNSLDFLLTRLYLPAYKIKEFNQLPIPFKAFATEIVTGEVVEFNDGDLGKAIRASMSIPSLFPPIRKEEKMYVDGGVRHNFPATDVKKMGADVVLGSYVGAILKDADELNSLVKIMVQAGFMMSIKDYDKEKEVVDLLMTPDVKMHSSLNFDLADFFIEMGYQAAMANKDALIHLRDSLGLRTKHDESQRLELIDSLNFQQIEVPNVSRPLGKLIREAIGFSPNRFLTVDNIEASLNQVYASKSFSSLRYHTRVNESDQNVLVVEAIPIKKATLGANINRFTSTGTSIILNAQLKNYLFDLNEIDLTTRVSDFPGVSLNLAQRGVLSYNSILGISGKMDYAASPIYVDNKISAEYNALELKVEPYWLYEFSPLFFAKASIGYRFIRLGNRINTLELSDKLRFKMNYTSLKVTYNSFTDHLMAEKGDKVDFNITYSNNAKIEAIDSVLTSDAYFIDVSLQYKKTLKHSSILYSRLLTKLSFSNALPYLGTTHIGGIYQDKDMRLPFSGVQESGIQESTFIYAHYDLDIRAYKNIYFGPSISFIAGLNDQIVIGGGLNTKVKLPNGPLLFNLGFARGRSKLVPSLGLGYRHIY